MPAFGKIIVGHDLHEGGDDAVALGRLIGEGTGATLVLAGVFPVGDLPRGFESTWREHEEEVARRLQAIADEIGAEGEGFPASSPARGLHDLAEEIKADLVVVGSSRHSKLGEILAGNVALGLLHGAPCAVAIAPRGYREQAAALSEIAVGFDGSEESRAALADAAELAGATAAKLRLVAVAPPAPRLIPGHLKLDEALESELREQVEGAKATLPDDLDAAVVVVRGDPAAELARVDASMLVVGSRGYGALRRVVLGSVSSALVRSARCPLLVEPRPARPE